MKLLIVSSAAKHEALRSELSGDFELDWSDSVPAALERLAPEPPDAVLAHLELGETPVLDLLCELRRRPAERMPGVVVLAADIDHRGLVEVVRTGAYDVLLEGTLQPRELVHAVRNAAYFAQSAASLAKRREAKSREVLVVGEGDGVEAIVMLLEAAGLSVRHALRLPQAGPPVAPRAILVDLSRAGDGEALLRLLAAS